jgi:glyoxalase family protein
MGLRLVKLTVNYDDPGTYVVVAVRPEDGPGRMGVGAVHHVAWRAVGDEAQLALRERLFEVATDPPGMTVDEPIDRLGSRLRFPPWLEHERGRIERALPAVQAPGIRPAAA